MNLLIIPARGGSKRIPRKNIKNFKGKPIIEWAIIESMKLNLFDKFIVSTDDEEIAEISAKAGFEIPFLRPKNLADDYTSTREVVIHAINFFNEKNVEFEKVCCLYPTTPLLDAEDISNAFQILKKSQKNVYVFSASIYSHPIQRSFFIEKNGLSKMFFPESFCERTQDLKSAFHDAGQFYIASAKTWLNNKNIFENGLPYILPQSKSIDIDTLDDWKLAELMHAINKK